MRGPFLTTQSKYLFVNKARIVALHESGALSDATLKYIKQVVAALGLDFDTLAGVYERYELEERSWEYSK
jgi:hypothetical protein